jgi:hypothetical protein
MIVNQLVLFGFSYVNSVSVAQEKVSLTLGTNYQFGLVEKSEVTLANAKVATKKHELRAIKMKAILT